MRKSIIIGLTTALSTAAIVGCSELWPRRPRRAQP
jgi:hypothetical protein